MFHRFFNLDSNPFGETPDTRFYFHSLDHHNCLTKLKWFIREGRGFALVSGEVGVGKTMLCRKLLQFLGDRAALVLYPKLSGTELLWTICEEFQLICAEEKGYRALGDKELLERLSHFLMEAVTEGRRMVLLIDEAQTLTDDALETLRLISNFETEEVKLLQVVLFAQEELHSRLNCVRSLRPLAQRISLNLRLNPFSFQETKKYILHRLGIAGEGHFIRFEDRAYSLIFQKSRGNPREINRIVEYLLERALNDKIRLIQAKWAKKVLGKNAGLVGGFLPLFKATTRDLGGSGGEAP